MNIIIFGCVLYGKEAQSVYEGVQNGSNQFDSRERQTHFWGGLWAWSSSESLHRWKKKSEEGNIGPFPGKGRLSLEDEEFAIGNY